MYIIILLWSQDFDNFEIWGCLLRIDAKLCCTQTSNIHGSSMAEGKYISLFKDHLIAQLV